MSAFQHRCEHRCICMQDAHEAVFLSNGIFSLFLHKAAPMHMAWKSLGAVFLLDCSHSSPHPAPQQLPPCHPSLLIFVNSRSQLILWQTNGCGSSPKGCQNKFLKKALFLLLPLMDQAVTAGIPKFSLKISVTEEKRENREPAVKQPSSVILSDCCNQLHFKPLLQNSSSLAGDLQLLCHHQPWLHCTSSRDHGRILNVCY